MDWDTTRYLECFFAIPIMVVSFNIKYMLAAFQYKILEFSDSKHWFGANPVSVYDVNKNLLIISKQYKQIYYRTQLKQGSHGPLCWGGMSHFFINSFLSSNADLISLEIFRMFSAFVPKMSE